ncbi:hypothetical protein NH288_05355 [Anaerococcus sp. NML200537]|uniref:hypothetical protein n=1 Tax=Anaerococcus sp. NML200537 TaxID=2954485 RepID=UPI0022382BEF|nr:hypothetical protein [Anaerococcus sp. NML200537]MCW6701510.1 hypothetical protein [Anaerococcus sp. NML200537]
MYKIQKQYFEGKNVTDVRLTQDEPYRDFVVSFEGKIEGLSDEEITQTSLAKLSVEFDPSLAFKDLMGKFEAMDTRLKSVEDSISMLMLKDMGLEELGGEI